MTDYIHMEDNEDGTVTMTVHFDDEVVHALVEMSLRDIMTSMAQNDGVMAEAEAVSEHMTHIPNDTEAAL